MRACRAPRLIGTAVSLALFYSGAAAAVCVNPWVTSDAKIYSSHPMPSIFSMEAFHASPMFKDLKPKEFCRTLFDIYYDGRRKNYGDFDKGLTLWAHTPQEPRNDRGIELDPVILLNVHGTGYCGIQSGLLEGIYQSRPGGEIGKPAIEARRWFLAGIVHSVCDAYYDGYWHYYDIDLGGWAGDAQKDVWSVADVLQNPQGYYGTATTIKSKYFYGADQNGKWVEKIGKSKSYCFQDNQMLGHEMTFFLRKGETFTRFFDVESAGWSEFPPHTKSIQKKQKGFCEIVWEPGRDDLDANVLVSSGGFQIFDIRCPYNITSSKVEADGKAFVSFDLGQNWTELPADGKVPGIENQWDYLLKVQSGKLKKITTRGMLHPGALPRVGNSATTMTVEKAADYRTLTFIPDAKGSSAVVVPVPAPPGCKIVKLAACVTGFTGTSPEAGKFMELYLGPAGQSKLVGRTTDCSWWGKDPKSKVDHGQNNVNGSIEMKPCRVAEVKVVPRGYGNVGWIRIYVGYKPDKEPPAKGTLVITHGFDGAGFARRIRVEDLAKKPVRYEAGRANRNQFIRMEVR